jgi:beta-galactosidase
MGISSGNMVRDAAFFLDTVRTDEVWQTVNNLGPQTAFPVPEGVLNYNGKNFIALTLWALDEDGAKLGGLELVPMMPVLSGYQKPAQVPQPAWTPRPGAY